MSVCLTGARCQRRVSGGCSQSSPCSPCGLCVAPGCSAPGFAAFDTLPPDFASRAGLQDALRLQPAPTICASTARAESGMLSGKPVLTTFDNTLFSLKGFNRCRELPKRAAACSVVRPRGDGRGQKRGDRCRPSRGPDARGVARSSHPPEHQSRTGWELAPTLETTLAELVKTMQAQNARLEAVEACRGLFGALWPRKAA